MKKLLYLFLTLIIAAPAYGMASRFGFTARKMVAAATVSVGTGIGAKLLTDNRPKIEQKQHMPIASIWLDTSKYKSNAQYKKQLFIQDCKQYATENNKIPVRKEDPSLVRIATYNIHAWKNPYGKKNLDTILDVINTIDADVIILQEAVLDPALMNYISTRLNCSLTNKNFCKTISYKNNTEFGNIIISKLPIHALTSHTYAVPQGKETRCFIKAELVLANQKKLSIYGTHLEVHDKSWNESKRVSEIKELLTYTSTDTNENIIIAGDLNAVRKEDYQYKIFGKAMWPLLVRENRLRGYPTPTKALDTLKANGFIDSFTKTDSSNPRFTVWTGTAVDFIFLSPQWNLPLAGSYIYYNGASDHLPVILDIKPI